jgi:phage terminase large subunit
MSDLSTDLKALLVLSYYDPLFFTEKVLRATPRQWQHRALEEIGARVRAGEKRLEVLIRACHGSGKSWLVGVLLIWWMATRPEARGLSLAPKWQIIEEVVWAEIRRLFAGSVLADLNVGRCLTTSLTFGPAWFASGASSDKPETLEGAHSPTAAIRITDEAKAVPDAVFTSTQGLLTAPEALDILISTPSIRSGVFYEKDIAGGDRVLRLVVTADDLIREGIPGIAEWKAECARKWGVESADYRSRVMAEYIEEGEGALYPFTHVERAMAQTWDVDAAPVGGLDCAGSVDGDENVLALACGPDDLGRYRVRIAGAWKEHDTMVSKGQTLALLRAAGASSCGVDSIGLGKGVHDALAMDFKGSTAYRASDRAVDPVRFLNRKAEDAWSVRELLEKGLLRLPPDPVLRAQFLAMRYEINAQGRLRVIDPSDSPDRHDAILIALAGERVGPGGNYLKFLQAELVAVRASRGIVKVVDRREETAPSSFEPVADRPFGLSRCRFFEGLHAHDIGGECLDENRHQRQMPAGWASPADAGGPRDDGSRWFAGPGESPAPPRSRVGPRPAQDLASIAFRLAGRGRR